MIDTKVSSGIQFAELARAAEGLTQWRPLLMGFLSILFAVGLGAVAGVSMFSVGGVVGVLLAGLIGLLALVVFFAGGSAVGVMLMDKARNLPVRSFGDAAMFGMQCIPKFLFLALCLVVAWATFALLASFLYWLCKIPYLGALLAFFIHPVLVLVCAFAFVAVACVVIPLFSPAVWSGLSFRDAIASLLAIAQKRLVHVVLMLIVLYVVVGVVMALILTGLLPALSIMSTIAASVISPFGSYEYGSAGVYMNPMAMLGNLSAGGMSGIAAGTTVLLVAVVALLMQVWLMGVNLLYLQAQDGVDASHASQGLGSMMEGLKQRAKEAKDSAVAAAERAKQAAAERTANVKAANSSSQPSEVESAPTTSEARDLQCPACHQAVQATDLFCGECGHKLPN